MTAMNIRELPSTLTFRERYEELRTLGYQDWQIAKRLNMYLASLVTMLQRNELPVSEQLSMLADEERKRRGVHHTQ